MITRIVARSGSAGVGRRSRRVALSGSWMLDLSQGAPTKTFRHTESIIRHTKVRSSWCQSKEVPVARQSPGRPIKMRLLSQLRSSCWPTA